MTAPRPVAETCEIVDVGPGRCDLRGAMTFNTAARLLRQVESRLRASPTPRFELGLGGVTRSDSAGLAMLIECVAIARSLGHELRVHDLPSAIDDIARISELESFLAQLTLPVALAPTPGRDSAPP